MTDDLAWKGDDITIEKPVFDDDYQGAIGRYEPAATGETNLLIQGKPTC